MHRPKYVRQLSLFLLAILLPGATLVGLAVHVVRNDVELTARRNADERARIVEQGTRELATRLSEIALRETSRSLPSWNVTPPRDPSVIYSAPVNNLLGPGDWLHRTVPEGDVRRRDGTFDALLALARDLPAIRSQLGADTFLAPRSSTAPRSLAWLAWGAEPWLVTITAEAPPVPRLVVIVSSRAVAPPGLIPVAAATPTSVPAGPPFMNLGFELSAGSNAGSSWIESAPFLVAGLVLVLAIMAFASYLLIRDVGREIRTAELRTEFVATVSHEIRTPLTVIRLFADKLVAPSGADDEARNRYVGTIVNECDRLNRLVDNVLEFARIEAGTKTYRLLPASIDEVIASAAKAASYLMEQKSFDLKVVVEPDLPMLLIDAEAMEQAILNLLTNAAKYSGESRDIRLHARRADSEVVVEVVDRGIGIDPSEHSRIFEKFYRTGNDATAHVAGTGLGLALVKHIVEAHSGRVDVQSSPGAGSTFSIRLPIPARPAAEAT